ncbi:right-handed parallel beta-helix repeat-containing protein [Halalkalicoccus salilacus]|uniref:right-handed parallel beta-helix repeat-containing protein n=1 Tax=Halalkalicoccus sp. GCM10025704 TaxID=3252662 RepID=UPI0036064906
MPYWISREKTNSTSAPRRSSPIEDGGGRDGALIYTDSRGYYGTRPYTLFDSGEPAGDGPSHQGCSRRGGFTRWDYDDNLAQAIRLRGPGGEIDNCEFFGWTWNAIHLKGDGESTVTEAEVHHNHIHKSYQLGYGYGIAIRRGFGEIHHNYFDETRHAVGGYGWWNSGFVVENNVFGPRQYSHTVDMHCLEENQATIRVGDDPDHPDYDLRAGGEMSIRNNTFCMDGALHGGGINAIAIRGVPWDGVWIENNRFTHSQRPPYNSGNNQEGFAWRQVNLNLSSWDPVPQDEEGYTLNWNDSNNQFGAPETPWESGYGAPIDLTDGSGRDEDQEGEEIDREEEQEEEGEDADERDVITISGDGSTTYYEFEFSVSGDVEKSEQYGATINGYDQISGSTVTGRTTNEPDSFAYAGEIVRFEADDGVEVLINGEEVDPATLGADEQDEEEDEEDQEGEESEDEIEQDVITISGDGSTTYYEFSVTGDVEKSEQYGATTNGYDQITGTTVTDRTTDQPDSFVFSGALTGFNADEPVDVSFNGEPTGIWI